MSRRAIFGTLAVVMASVVLVALATLAMLDAAEPPAEASTGAHSVEVPSIGRRWNLISYPWWVRVWEGT